VHCHAGCSAKDIQAELGRRGLLEGRSDRRVAVPPPIDRHDRAHRIEVARCIWARGRDTRGTPVVEYLAGRGLDVVPLLCLRWAPRCWHRDSRAELPAMLVRVDGPDGTLVGVHRAYFQRDRCGEYLRKRPRQKADRTAGGTAEEPSYELNIFRVIRLPATQAGKGLLRQADRMIGRWGNSGGAALEEFDWGASAAEEQRLLDGHRGGH
jgi:hypothetical protein